MLKNSGTAAVMLPAPAAAPQAKRKGPSPDSGVASAPTGRMTRSQLKNAASQETGATQAEV